MKLIATAKTFSCDDMWTKYQIYKHKGEYRVLETQHGLGWFPSETKTIKYLASLPEVKEILSMDLNDRGTVNVIDDKAVDLIFDD